MIVPGALPEIISSHLVELLAAFADEADDEGCPAGLVGCAEAFAGFGVEVFVEKKQVLPIGRVAVAVGGAEAGAVAVFVGKQQGNEAITDINGDFTQCGLFF